ncbi:hypothetical protein K470DRAFT_152143 [Piedraia hortae CBS 480.64]|uniref:Mid2 domain-containing protein n=1 Tax=Piedraia hortae CBS 480.64 TaxID=1314780 RepID=A0A6A7BRK3_9PEZI|nr:hypothetical protein K470DRAFT_152143 [Piedraia hortae CBS 480.64]
MMIVVLLSPALPLVAAQICYNPDLSHASDQYPCSSQGGNCCPLGYVCLSSGLCHSPSDDTYGRFGCTNTNWTGCLEPCTTVGGHPDSAPQHILHCSNYSADAWCCNVNNDPRQPCCKKKDISWFVLKSPGKALTTIGGESVATSSAGSLHSSSSTRIPSSTPGLGKHSNHKSIIIGTVIGLLSALLIIALLSFCYWRRRRLFGRGVRLGNQRGIKLMEKHHAGHVSPSSYTPELDSQPITSPTNTFNSDMEGSTATNTPVTTPVGTLKWTTEPK